jgi:hypothetical protein
LNLTCEALGLRLQGLDDRREVLGDVGINIRLDLRLYAATMVDLSGEFGQITDLGDLRLDLLRIGPAGPSVGSVLLRVAELDAFALR